MMPRSVQVAGLCLEAQLEPDRADLARILHRQVALDQ